MGSPIGETQPEAKYEIASLIPDPDDPECPDEFRKLVMKVLGKSLFKPKHEDGQPIEDSPRTRCLEFIKHLVRWENSNNPDFTEPARKLIVEAHKLLHPHSAIDRPRVLDPFAGGGAIPLEAIRLGCDAHAIDINPVAHLIQLCTLVYPQTFGQPQSRPVPDYINRLIAHNEAHRKSVGDNRLFDHTDNEYVANDGELIPDVAITEQEFIDNPLAADVMYWGHWVLQFASTELSTIYPIEDDGSEQMA